MDLVIPEYIQKSKNDSDLVIPFAKKKEKPSSILEDIKAATAGFASSLVPSGASIAGGSAAMSAAAPLAEGATMVGGPLAGGAVELTAALGGAIAGGYAASKAQDIVIPDHIKKSLEESKKEHPRPFFFGELVSGAPFFGPGKATLAVRGVMATVGGGAEAARQLAAGEKFDATKIAMATGAGGLLTKPTKLGGAIAPAFADKPAKVISTGFMDKETGEIIKTGVKHPEAPKKDPKFEQGFVDENGQFLPRKEAHNRAIETGQVSKDYQLERPEEGLHSGDLRANGDRHFSIDKTSTDIPKFVNGIPVYVEKTGRTRTDGTPVAASAFKKDGVVKKIVIDQEQLNKDFEQKVWTKPKMQGVEPLPEDSFKTPAEYTAFVLAHEREHSLQNFNDFHKEQISQKGLLPKSEKQLRGEYEDMMNKRAMEAIQHPITLRGAGEMIGKVLNNVRANTRLSKIFKQDIEKAVPNAAIRVRMTRALEAEKSYDRILTDKEKQEALYGSGKQVLGKHYTDKGMVGALHGMELNYGKGRFPEGVTAEQYATKIDRFEKVIEHLQSLPSEEHAIPVMATIKDKFAEIGGRAKKEGLLKGMYDNYVTHLLDWKEFKGTESQKQAILDKIFNAPKESKLSRDFTAQRQYETLRELEKAVEGTGVKVEKDIAKIVEAYSNSMETAILEKRMIDKLKVTDAPNGKPYIVPVSTEALKDKYVPFQGKGSKPLEGLLVHPDLAPTMGQLYRQSDPNIFLRTMGSVTHLTKALNTVASLFHATSLGQAHLLANPSNALREVFTGGKGIRQAVDAFKHGNDASMSALIDGFIREGLVAGTEDIQRTIIPEVGKAVDTLISRFGPKTTLATRATETLDQHVLQHLNKFTWDYMHTGQKLNLAINLFNKAKAKNPNIPDEQIQKEVARMVNETFGGLNWADIANQVQNKYAKAFAERAANIHGREWAQIMFFAPDWTVSTVRAFTSALPKEINKPKNWDLKGGIKGIWNPSKQGDFARRYVLNTAIAYFTILNAINYATSGHFIWENKDKTRIDLGDGTSMQAAKHSMEFAEWVLDPMKTFGNKLGFIPKATYIEVSGHAYPSPDAPKIKPAYDGYGGMELAKAKAIATTALPFQAGSAVQAPTGEAAKRAIASTLGLPIYGLTKEEKAAAIKKGKAEARARRAKKRAQIEDARE